MLKARAAVRWCECATDVQICRRFVHVIRMCRFHVHADFRSRKTTRRGSCDQRAVLPGVKLSGMGCTRRPSQKPFARRAQDSVYCEPTQPIVGSESGLAARSTIQPGAGWRSTAKPLRRPAPVFGVMRWNANTQIGMDGRDISTDADVQSAEWKTRTECARAFGGTTI
jgi:hypothetical protein